MAKASRTDPHSKTCVVMKGSVPRGERHVGPGGKRNNDLYHAGQSIAALTEARKERKKDAEIA